jgi:hypothetical protein
MGTFAVRHRVDLEVEVWAGGSPGCPTAGTGNGGAGGLSFVDVPSLTPVVHEEPVP